MKKLFVQMIFASLLISGLAIAEEVDLHTFFKSVEHQWLGEQAKLPFPEAEPVQATDHKLRLPNTNKLSYGQIIALGGDYYGVPDAPISDGTSLADRVSRFKNAFDTLANEEQPECCDFEFCANKILDVFESESKRVQSGKIDEPLKGLSFSYVASVQQYTDGRYMSLAIMNWDHFLPTSMSAYEAGHTAAIQQALLARSLPTVAQQTEALELAYAMNAFADHFMTDMFSSGHVRVPRKELYEQSSFASVGGLIARQMHDEDGIVGLKVKNASGAKWKMYGDGRLFITEAEANKKAVSFAVQSSIAEVYAAFKYGKVLTPDLYGVKKLAPKIDEHNSAPLYVLVDGVVLARTKNDLCSFEWSADWTGVGQLLNYSSPQTGPCI